MLNILLLLWHLVHFFFVNKSTLPSQVPLQHNQIKPQVVFCVAYQMVNGHTHTHILLEAGYYARSGVPIGSNLEVKYLA